MILFLLVVVSIVTLTVKIWIPLRQSSALKLEILNGSTIIVKEIDSLFQKAVDVSLDREHINSTNFNRSTTNIDFYGVATSCDQIYGTTLKERKFCLTEKDISSHVPEYALKGSIFKYEISGNTSKNEYMLICTYCGADYKMCHRKKCKKLYLNEGSGSYKVSEHGYYSFRVEDSEGMDFKLCIDESLVILDPFTDESLRCSINTTNERCHFLLPLKTKYCVMAEFSPTRLALPSVELDVKVGDSRFVIMLITPLSILFFIVLLVSFVVCVPLCCCKICKTKRSMVTIV